MVLVNISLVNPLCRLRLYELSKFCISECLISMLPSLIIVGLVFYSTSDCHRNVHNVKMKLHAIKESEHATELSTLVRHSNLYQRQTNYDLPVPVKSIRSATSLYRLSIYQLFSKRKDFSPWNSIN